MHPNLVLHASKPKGFPNNTNLQTPGAPLNCHYPNENDPNCGTNCHLWPQIHALENLRYIAGVFGTFATTPVFVLDAMFETLQLLVRLLDAVISPPYETEGHESVCNFADMGGNHKVPGPTGKPAKRTVTPHKTSKIQQLVQCFGATSFRIIEMALRHLFAWMIGICQSISVLIRYWVEGQWRFAVVAPGGGPQPMDPIQTWEFPLERKTAVVGGKGPNALYAYCNDESLFSNIDPPVSLCNMGPNVYKSGNLSSGDSNPADVYNVAGHNGCACGCLKHNACAFYQTLPYSCAFCIFESLVDELAELQFILESILQIGYWAMMLLMDAFAYAFGTGSEQSMMQALTNFLEALVSFLSVFMKIVYNMILQIPIIGPIIKWIIEELVCDFVIDIVINTWLVTLYPIVCNSIETVCNSAIINWFAPVNCGFSAGACTQFHGVSTCAAQFAGEGANMTTADIATSCEPAWMTGNKLNLNLNLNSKSKPEQVASTSVAAETVLAARPHVAIQTVFSFFASVMMISDKIPVVEQLTTTSRVFQSGKARVTASHSSVYARTWHNRSQSYPNLLSVT